jgi:hypothetical protein
LFFYLQFGSSHYISYAVDDTFILFLKLVSLEEGCSVWITIVGVRDGVPLCFDSWFGMPKIGVVPSFVLKIEKLLCFFDIH